jgi:hypothetical protein
MSSSTETFRKVRPAKARSGKDSETETSDSETETSDSEEETSESETEDEKDNSSTAGSGVAKGRPGAAIVCLPRHPPTCDYEEERASNITRNRAILENLIAQIPLEESPFQSSKPKLKKKSRAEEKLNVSATRKSARLNKVCLYCIFL